MATLDQIKALISSHMQDDDERFTAITLQIAAHAGKSGPQIREMANRMRPRSELTRLPRGVDELLLLGQSVVRLGDMVLSQPLRADLERVLLEYRSRGSLLEHGLSPAQRLLLTGPPGTGKTMTASALAGELGLPLYVLRVESAISHFLGETASKLVKVFDTVPKIPAVYLMDEFDVIGRERGAEHDVGEMRRVTNSVLQFLERGVGSSIVLCATNHQKLLDSAMARRFDAVLTYSIPTEDMAKDLLRSRLACLNCDGIDWDTAAATAFGLSHSELVSACNNIAKRAILGGVMAISADGLNGALQARKEWRNP